MNANRYYKLKTDLHGRMNATEDRPMKRDKVRSKPMTKLPKDLPPAQPLSVRHCGECLMNDVEIVQLDAKGICPRCKTDYGV